MIDPTQRDLNAHKLSIEEHLRAFLAYFLGSLAVPVVIFVGCAGL